MRAYLEFIQDDCGFSVSKNATFYNWDYLIYDMLGSNRISIQRWVHIMAMETPAVRPGRKSPTSFFSRLDRFAIIIP
jgi:hypothetical protein